MIILGSLVFTVSFAGCFGAAMMNTRVLAVFSWILLAFVIIQLLMVIVTMAMQTRVDPYLDDMWQAAYDRHPRIIRDIQDEFACCGFKNPEDRAIPRSSPDACVKSPYFGYETPCFSAIKHTYKSQQQLIIIVGLILVGVQVLSLVCAFMLHRYLSECELGLPEHQGLLRHFTEREGTDRGASVGERT